MNDDFRKGFILGMAMNPLYVVTEKDAVASDETVAVASAVLIAETFTEFIKPAEIPGKE